MITVSTDLCSVCVCTCVGSAFLRPPDSDSSKSQLPADRVGASHWEEDLPTSHRKCDSSALIWPEDENINI